MIGKRTEHFIRSFVIFIAVVSTAAPVPAAAIQTFPGGIVRNEKTLFDPNLAQNGTVELAGVATFSKPITVTVPFVNTETVNPSLWATAPEIIVSLVHVEGDVTGGYTLDVFDVNHNTFALSIRPSKHGASLRKIVISYMAVGHRANDKT